MYMEGQEAKAALAEMQGVKHLVERESQRHRTSIVEPFVFQNTTADFALFDLPMVLIMC